MKALVSQLVSEAIHEAMSAGELKLGHTPDPDIERPRDASHGDWATAVALRCAKAASMNPRAIAEIIASHLASTDMISSVEIAGPGFINLRLSAKALQERLTHIFEADRENGRSDLGAQSRVQVEFVSANPVGPMHVGHGRWAALGDALSNILEHTGYSVGREFYINDAGVQMDIFGESVSARYLELCGRDVVFPENGYQGAYITDIAQEIFDEEGAAWADATAQERENHFREKSYVQVLAHLKEVLHDFGVDFDDWFSERTLHAKGPDGSTAITRAFDTLQNKGALYESEGALWFRSTDHGDDKDRVLVKADGEYTYFAADIAYHKSKFDRGYDQVIDIWGADHHGYVARMKGACAALGYPNQLEVIIGQLVNLFRDGEPVRMSKRTGEMVSFEELLEEVGNDAARYWFLRRSTDQQVDFDIEVARKQSNDNPVYYVQYAYARICSLLRKAAAEASVPEKDSTDATVDLLLAGANAAALNDEGEFALIRKLDEFAATVETASRDYAPYKLTHYAEELAATFHRFYSECRVMHDDVAIRNSRLYLVEATRRVLRVTLLLLGVSTPERM